MKLIPLITLTLSLAVNSKPHEPFTFPSHFQGPHSPIFTSEKQFYLPPESHTAAPYFPMKNFNDLPFPYLPPAVTKFPPGSPSPYPMVLSSTLLPMTSDDEDDDDKPSTQLPPFLRNQQNRTQREHIPKLDRREMRLLPNNYQHPIDRIDTKLPFPSNANSEITTPISVMKSMLPRSVMIADIQREYNTDQFKAGSSQAAQYLPQPGVFISTTETAIPILRLSNEMDLDGSFSYEALGADQTHYVQHSRMENMGADKEEQIVEGSYSYVGDNGKTYTVHYVADSNGFRASGDHLPVPPPVPEIIQRAVQYNIAEEMKKPPNLKSWNEEQQENELSESEKRHRFAIAPPRLSNLFTGKTPESFSHSFSQPPNHQNNLVSAGSFQTPIQTINFTDQKQNSATISPQITFLASQGAHIPSMNKQQQQQQQPISRIFTTERPILPQIVNYEADIKDQESNKPLWRWQYGITSDTNPNQNNMDKNLISRSSGADDISINFNDMTADQYSKMLQQQLEPNVQQTSVMPQQFQSYENQGQFYNNLNKYTNVGTGSTQHNNNNFNTILTNDNQYSTVPTITSTGRIDWSKQQNNYPSTEKAQSESSQTSRPKLITQDMFIPRSQTVTQSYNYDNTDFESRRTRILNKNNVQDMNLNVLPLNYEKSMPINTPRKIEHVQKIFPIEEPTEKSTNLNNIKYSDLVLSETRYKHNEERIVTTQKPLVMPSEPSNIKFLDFIVKENQNEFKPIYTTQETSTEAITTTTENSIESMFEENIFLKNLFKNNQDEEKLKVKPVVEAKIDKYPNPKYIKFEPKPYNEIKANKQKPIDIAEIMNYLTRNQFESNKVRSKPKQIHNNFKQKNEMQYYSDDEDRDVSEDYSTRNYRTLQQQDELSGVIKNYKVLQRNNQYTADDDDIDGPKRTLSPPPVKVNLPPLGRAGPSMKSYLPPVYV